MLQPLQAGGGLQLLQADIYTPAEDRGALQPLQAGALQLLQLLQEDRGALQPLQAGGAVQLLQADI